MKRFMDFNIKWGLHLLLLSSISINYLLDVTIAIEIANVYLNGIAIILMFCIVIILRVIKGWYLLASDIQVTIIKLVRVPKIFNFSSLCILLIMFSFYYVIVSTVTLLLYIIINKLVLHITELDENYVE